MNETQPYTIIHKQREINIIQIHIYVVYIPYTHVKHILLIKCIDE